MKIDIKGHEIEALQGDNLLFYSEDRPIIFIEFNEQSQNYLASTCKDLANFLIDRSYELYIIDDELPLNVLAVPINKIMLMDGLSIDRSLLKPYHCET